MRSPALRVNRSACGNTSFTRPQAVRLCRRKRFARQDQFLGAALADGARQGLRAAAARHDAERDLGQREARGLGGVEEIATAGDLAAAAIGRTVDGADDRHRAVDQRPHHPLEDDMLARPLLRQSCRGVP